VKSSLHQWSEICCNSVVFLSSYLLAMTMRQPIPATRRLSLLLGELQRICFSFLFKLEESRLWCENPSIGAL
jgi:hypothetical protein